MRNFFLLIILIASFVGKSQQPDTIYLEKLALHWAPIHYQSIRKSDGIFNTNSLNGKSDSLSSMNFDGDWIATNNWDNLEKHPTVPVVYYYISETATHYFITYGYFHPRDWTKLNFFRIGQHENDLEGALFVIEKDTTKWGKLLVGYSVFHLSLKKYKYTDQIEFASKPFKNGRLEGHRPISHQQPRGHGIKLDPSFQKVNRPFCRYTPEKMTFPTVNDKQYRLVNLGSSGQLIEQRKNNDFFNPDESIKGSHGEGANPPWRWKDRKDKRSYPHLQLFIDPAKYLLIDCIFKTPFSTDYIYHPFLNIQ